MRAVTSLMPALCAQALFWIPVAGQELGKRWGRCWECLQGSPECLPLLLPRASSLDPVGAETPAEVTEASVSPARPQGSDSELDR